MSERHEVVLRNHPPGRVFGNFSRVWTRFARVGDDFSGAETRFARVGTQFLRVEAQFFRVQTQFLGVGNGFLGVEFEILPTRPAAQPPRAVRANLWRETVPPVPDHPAAGRLRPPATHHSAQPRRPLLQQPGTRRRWFAALPARQRADALRARGMATSGCHHPPLGRPAITFLVRSSSTGPATAPLLPRANLCAWRSPPPGRAPACPPRNICCPGGRSTNR